MKILGTVKYENLNKLFKTVQKKDFKWLNGFNPKELPDYLSQYSLTLIEDIGASEYQERYLKPINREMNVFEIECVALAEVKKTKYL